MKHSQRLTWFVLAALIVVPALIVLFGCAATVKQTLTPLQRTNDLRFPCDICGQPAKMNATENWYRCEECERPREVKPVRVPRRKLETQIVKG